VIEIVALRARISESSPHDLRGVQALGEELPRRLDAPAAEAIHGRDGPFGSTPWQQDLDASRALLAEAGDRLAGALDAGRTPVLLATDCALALGTLPVLAERVPDARVLWLDAHSDYDTPATTTIGFLGCMSLAGASGAWDSGLGSMPARRVVHYGARIEPGDFDEAGHREADASELTMIPIGSTERALAALDGAPVYIHLDPDVLDPSVFPVPYGRRGGLSAAALRQLAAAVADASPVLGLELTAYHAPEDRGRRELVTDLLAGVVERLLRN
jgi:arginase